MNKTSRKVADGEWELFADWCRAHHERALPATLDTVGRFAHTVSGAPSTIKHRLWSIASVHARAGFDFELSRTTPSVAWRSGESWPTAGQALAKIPIYGWTSGYRGRRDAVLIVAIGVLGFSRRETIELTGSDVTFDGQDYYLAGHAIPRDQSPGACPSCAVARWLPLLTAVESWSRADAQAIVMAPSGPTAGDCTKHCCRQIAESRWPQHVPLLPSIDQYGYAGDSLTPRAVSAILSSKQSGTFNGAPGSEAGAHNASDADRGRFAGYSMDELVDALDDLDDAAEQAASESSEVLNVARTMATYMASLQTPDR